MSEPKAKTAAVHDLGYKAYEGVRRPQRTRYRVMMWKQLAIAWRGWWRMKSWVISGAMIVVGFGIAIYAFSFLTKNKIVSGMFGAGGVPLRMTDFLLPESVRINTFVVFVLGLTVVAGIVADDLKGGAFEFYFSRPIRPWDYLVGKFLGAVLVLGTVGFGVPVVLSLVRIGFSGGTDELLRSLPLLPKAIAVGVYTTVVFAAIPLGLSALGSRRRYTIAAWAMFYVVISNVAMGIARETGILEIGAISPFGQVMSFTYEMFGIEPIRKFRLQPPIGVAVAGSAAYVALGLGLVYWRVRRAEKRGMGGG